MHLLLLGMIMGFTVSLPPGPVAFEILKRGLGRGFLVAFPLGIGAALADLTYASLVYFGMVRLINNNPIIKVMIFLVGGLLLIFLAVMGIIRLKKGTFHVGVDVSDDVVEEDKHRNPDKTVIEHLLHFLKRTFLGYTMTIFNPAGFLFFLTLFPPVFANILQSNSREMAYLFVVGFPLGVIFLFSLEAAFASMFRRFLKELIFKRIAFILNAAMGVIGLYFLFRYVEIAILS